VAWPKHDAEVLAEVNFRVHSYNNMLGTESQELGPWGAKVDGILVTQINSAAGVRV
jgi:hypothetical protein